MIVRQIENLHISDNFLRFLQEPIEPLCVSRPLLRRVYGAFILSLNSGSWSAFSWFFLQSISDLLSECFSLCDKNSCSLCDNLLICGVIIHTVYYTDFKYEVVLEIFSIFSGRQQYWQCELPGGISQWLEIKPTARPNKQAPPPPPPSPPTHTHT